MSISLTYMQSAEPVLVLFLDYSALKRPLWRFNDRFSKAFCVLLKESLEKFIHLLYAILTFQLFIKESSCSTNAKVMYVTAGLPRVAGNG